MALGGEKVLQPRPQEASRALFGNQAASNPDPGRGV